MLVVYFCEFSKSESNSSIKVGSSSSLGSLVSVVGVFIDVFVLVVASKLG